MGSNNQELLKLDLGRGGKRRLWKTVDIDPDKEPDILCNCVFLAPFKDNSVQEIFTSHMIEHIHPLDTMTALFSWYNKLIPTGMITIYTPDIRLAFKRYENRSFSEQQVIDVMIGADPNREYQLHLNLFWFARLCPVMFEVGFRNINELPARQGRVEFGLTAVK